MDGLLEVRSLGVAEAPLPRVEARNGTVNGHRRRSPTERGEDEEIIALPRELFEEILALARVFEPDLDVESELLPWPPRGPAKPRNASVTWARKLYQLRRRRAAYFDAALFAEPAWDMLLDLFVAEIEGRRVQVLTACIGAAAPQTTALRWLRALEGRGLVRREYDSKDGRRIYVRLTETATNRMRCLLRESQMIAEWDKPHERRGRRHLRVTKRR